jgi:hypothetical protein
LHADDIVSKLKGIGSGKGRKAAAWIQATLEEAPAGAAYLIAGGSARLDADEVRGPEELALRAAARLHCLCSRRPPPRPLQRLKLHTSLSWGVRAWRWMSSPFALPMPRLTAKLSEEAMLDAKVAEEAILIAELAEEAIRIGKLAEMAFLIAKLAEEAILIAKLAKEAMLTLKLAEEAILIAELAEEAVLIAELTSSPAAVSCKWRAA